MTPCSRPGSAPCCCTTCSTRTGCSSSAGSGCRRSPPSTALRLPAAERACRAAVLTCDVALLDALNADVARAEAELAAVLPDTPAAVLTSLPGVSTVRASAYGAALGDPARFTTADAAYRLAGMHPTSYDSTGSSRGGQKLSRRGSAELRHAIVDLGRGLAQRDEHFVAYRASLLGRGADRGRTQAHRLAFGLLRTQQPYDPDRYARSLASGGERRTPLNQVMTGGTGGPVNENDREAACRHAVTPRQHPPCRGTTT